jgi:hypothetical protein
VSGFRGSDETLEAEIATIEAIARVRLRRVAREMEELERELRALKRERARRRAAARVPGAVETALEAYPAES